MAETKKEAKDDKPERAVLKVELRDEADSTVAAMESLIGRMGGKVKSQRGRNWTVEGPLGTDQDATAGHSTFVNHLLADPLVAEVEHG